MPLRRKIYLIISLLSFFLGLGHAQTESISGIVNSYAAIETILAWESNNVDSVLLTDATGFDPGDTVMIYCVQGAEIELTDIFGEGDIGRDAQNPRNTGKYAFLLIDKIDGNTVIFNTTVRPEIGPLGPGEVAQLIRVPSYHRALVMPSGVTAQDWNGSTGGVVALFVRTVLELNGDINVSGKGFRGAVASTPYYNGDCSSVNPILYDSNFYHIDNIRAGIKGEGTTDTRFDLMRGKARNINGGGGGNARFSGGGGGSNFSSGGKGGNESALCAPGALNLGGAGGFDLGRNDAYYINGASLNRQNRIFFGGGGGTGTVISGRTTTGGGDGGGLVIIIADTIKGNGNWIRANGSAVTANATGAGGGGGGGGAIILDVSGYKDNPWLSAFGGKGGNTNHPTDATGPGGGGGGGIYWLAGSNEPGVSPDETGFGASGMYLTSGIKNGAADGAPPKRKDGLDAPLRGFLFNSVPSEFWVCSDQVPDPILASKPKGGSGSYSYSWIDSSSTQNQWQVIPGATGQSLAFTAPLADTVYFRRIVKEVPQILPPDTSFRIAVYVHQAITNNTISAPDTVCQGNIPVPFVPVGLPGAGIGTYKYSWQKDEGSGIYSPANGTNTQPGYVPPAGLNVSTNFARITTSGACADTSAPLRITVFAPISNNIIADYDTICVNTAPELITQDPEFTIGGGDPDPTNWRYRWQSGPALTGPWAEVAGATASAYQPGNLTATIWYRREVLSGNEDACVDFSAPVEILNVPAITNNLITTADQTVCTGDQPQLMQGSVPGGGHPAQIYYKWESSTTGSGWVEADNTNGNNLQSYTPPVMTGDTTFYRRVVSSGGLEGVCTNTSGAKTIQVIPAIVNNTISTAFTLNCQFDNLSDLLGSIPGGGATEGGADPTRNYRWEQSTGEAPGVWTEISYGPDEQNFNERPELSSTDDYWYRRVVLSGPDLGGQNQVCTSSSDTIHVVIHTAISNNEIDAADSACFNTEKLLQGALPAGEDGIDPLYSWRDLGNGSELGTVQTLPFTFTTLDDRQFNRIVQLGACEDTSNIMGITVMELPGGTLSGELPETCEVISQLDVELNVGSITNYNTDWVISFSNGVDAELVDQQDLDANTLQHQVDVDLSNPDDVVSTQYNYTIGRIVYELSDGTECVAPPENLVGNVPIEVFHTPRPEIGVITVTVEDSICGDVVELEVDPNKGTGSWSNDNPAKLRFTPDAESLSVSAIVDTSYADAWDQLPYLIYFTSTAGVCSGYDTIGIYFFEQPDDADAGPEDTIYFRNSVYLNAEPATAGVGKWTVKSGSGDIVDGNDPKTLVTGLVKGGRNEFTWEITNGVCETSDDFTVITQDKAQPYEGFSPNDDGLNDYFIIRGLADATEFSMSIFNALGNSVRTINQDNVSEIVYNPGAIPGGLRDDEMVIWDGRSNNGNIVPPGTYYYVLNLSIDQLGPAKETDFDEQKYYIVVSE